MPPEALVGRRIPHLLAEARARYGDDAMLLDVRPTDGAGGAGYELRVVGAPAASAPDAPATPATTRPARPVAPVWQGRATRPRVVALVGPTGAGKTTTVAKLASHPDAYRSVRAGILNLDTYRVGAIEQSRMYAELVGCPCEVAYDHDELARAAKRLAGLDVVLVDTAGRGPRQGDGLAATQALVAALAPDEVHLVAPAGLSPVRVRRLADDFAGFAPTHLLITKLDEYPDERALFALARDRGLATRFHTDGQEVPGDLHVAAAAPLARAPHAGMPAGARA